MPTTDLEVTPEVRKALDARKAVVALESTIISHGMPYPQNVETALKVEEIVRDNGAVPATIAILDGKLRAGLSVDQIEYLGKMGQGVTKASRRDIPFVLARKLPAATTVAATMIIAARAGIKVFATGGIGGVHRGAAETFDISADLEELACTDVAVICAGAKAILDIGLTLEYLETKGVPVVGYGTDELPAFYTRKSGFPVDYRVDDPMELAKVLQTKWALGLKGGMVVANPIPEKDEMAFNTVNRAIEKALQEMDRKEIRGKRATPYLLARVAALTGGDSLTANISLVYNNAALGAQMAVCLAAL